MKNTYFGRFKEFILFPIRLILHLLFLEKNFKWKNKKIFHKIYRQRL